MAGNSKRKAIKAEFQKALTAMEKAKVCFETVAQITGTDNETVVRLAGINWQIIDQNVKIIEDSMKHF